MSEIIFVTNLSDLVSSRRFAITATINAVHLKGKIGQEVSEGRGKKVMVRIEGRDEGRNKRARKRSRGVGMGKR